MSAAPSVLMHWLPVTALLFLLGVFLFVKLSAAGYLRSFAAVVSAIALFHPAFADPRTGVMSVLFALTVCAVAVSALAFGRNQDARRTILLGGSLAGAQLVNPLCGMLSALSVPLTLRTVLRSGQTGRTFGQILSVLFIPALIAVLLISTWIGQHEVSLSWNPESGARLSDGGEALVHTVIAIAPLAIWLFGLGGRARSVFETIGGLCAILLATSALDGLLGIRAVPDVTSAVGPLAIIVLSATEPKEARVSSAVLLIVSSVAASWIPVDRIASFVHV